MPDVFTTQYVLRREGLELFRGTKIECMAFVHDAHLCSLTYALKYDGFSLEEIVEPEARGHHA